MISVVHRVTFRPSFKQCSGRRFSDLHNMKSSLKGLQYAPMKKAADFKGADVVPTSWTSGIVVGRGFGSTYGTTVALLLVYELMADPR